MKIAKKIAKPLGQLIAGDTGVSPYLRGPELVEFFNDLGYDDVYEQGFPSRWAYVTEKILITNGTDMLRKIFEEYMDGRRFNGDENMMEGIAQTINSMIKYDGYALINSGGKYRIADINGNVIESTSAKAIGHEFITEQITKCHKKIHEDDYNGAITNARTLTEAVLIHIIESIEKVEIKNDGNLIALWSRAKKALKIDLNKEVVPDFIFQIIAGLDTSLNGLAALSNNAGDRHANKFRTKKHHAKLAVNLAMTLSDFLIDVIQDKSQQS